MQYYHLSYDLINVEANDNDEALKELISLIQKQLGGEVLNRPVRSTLIFTSSLGFDFVRNAVYSWSKDRQAYYVVSEISNLVNEGPQCRLVSNKNLEDGLSAAKKDGKASDDK